MRWGFPENPVRPPVHAGAVFRTLPGCAFLGAVTDECLCFARKALIFSELTVLMSHSIVRMYGNILSDRAE
jgi:hypothetical protein